MESRKGKEWTKKEDELLKKCFLECLSYKQMAKKLNRTWFACKCRLARLGLIEPFERNDNEFYIGSLAPNVIPYTMDIETVLVDNSEVVVEGTSNTFSNAELNIVTDWLKSRLSRVVCKLADGEHCFIMGIELEKAKEFLETEIKVVNSMKKITVKEREKVCKRLC